MDYYKIHLLASLFSLRYQKPLLFAYYIVNRNVALKVLSSLKSLDCKDVPSL